MSQTMSRSKMPHTHVIQSHITNVGGAASHFAHHENKNSQPIVLVPSAPCCCTCCLTVPAGFWVLGQNWGFSMGGLDPGFHWCWPFWKRVSHVVTKKAICYDHPVNHCPTSDNVMVEVNMAVTFQIGPTAKEAEAFVYKLGACNFDNLLSAACDEAVRGLVNKVPVMRVLDLRGEMAGSIYTELDAALGQFGVVIRHVAITDVLLPLGLEKLLGSRTSFETKIEQDRFTHKLKMLELNNREHVKLLKIKRRVAREVDDLEEETKRAMVRRNELETECQMDHKVATIDDHSKAEVAKIRATSQRDNAANVAEAEAIKLVIGTKARKDADMIIADQEHRSAIIRTEAFLELATAKASAVTATAKVEEKAADVLQTSRDFELQHYRMVMLKQVAADSNMIVCGDMGDTLLQSLVPGGKGDLSKTHPGILSGRGK